MLLGLWKRVAGQKNSYQTDLLWMYFTSKKKRLLNFSSAAALVHYRAICHGWNTYWAQLFRWRLPFKIRPVIPSGGSKGAPRATCLGCHCCYCGMEKGYTNQGSIYLLTLLLARVYLLYWYTWWHMTYAKLSIIVSLHPTSLPMYPSHQACLVWGSAETSSSSSEAGAEFMRCTDSFATRPLRES